MKKRKFMHGLILVMVFQLFMSAFSMCASADDTEWKCGKLLSWNLEDGTLTITGYGEMYDYELFKKISGGRIIDTYLARPWEDKIDDINKIVISEGVTSIGAYVFSYTPNLTSIIMADSVLLIGEAAFEDCKKLTSVQLSDNLAEISKNAFKNCTRLKNTSFPKTLVRMGTEAFRNTGFTEFTIPNNIKTKYIISGSNLNTVIGPFDAVNDIWDYAMDNGRENNNLENIIITSGKIDVYDFSFGKYGQYSGYDEYDECSYTERKRYENNTVKSITLNKGVTFGETDDYGVFTHFKALEKVVLPSDLKEIPNYAFLDCKKIKSISMPTGVTKIGYGAFENSGLTLTNLVIPSNIKSIDSHAYTGINITDLTIPSTTVVEEDAFNDNENSWGSNTTIKRVTAPISFFDSNNLEAVEEINVNGGNLIESFYNQSTKLKKLTISNSIQTIYEGSFYDIDNLQFISLPFIGKSRTEMEEQGTFPYIISGSNDDNFFEITSSHAPLKGESIPETLKKVIVTDADNIAASAFAGCSPIEEIELNEGIKTIGQYAFADMGFLSVKLPKSLTAIGSNAFLNTDVVKLYVPANSYALEYAKKNGYNYEIYGSSSSSTGSSSFETPEAETYTIKYSANGGSGAPGSQTKTAGVNIKLRTGMPTRSGYTFVGWAVSSSAASNGNASYDPGDYYKKDASITFYAVWEKNPETVKTYTIYYNANGGSGVPTSETKAAGETIILKSPTRSGYKFKGWATSATAAANYNIRYDPGAKYKHDANLVLYAVWSKDVVTYTINYYANGGSGAPSSQTKESGSYITLRTETPTRSGYKFKGWATSSTSSTVKYQPGDTFANNSNLSLYAVWEKTVKYSNVNQRKVTVNIPTFRITINGQKIYNTKAKYPYIVYNDITYFPMTYNGARFLGIKSDWNKTDGLTVSKLNSNSSTNETTTQSSTNSGYYTAYTTTGYIQVNGTYINNSAEQYPLINFRDVTYFPLTWRFAVLEFGWDYKFTNSDGLVINSK